MPTALVKGGNALITDGKVRSDLDMIFHNQPPGPSGAHGAVRYLGKGDRRFGVTDRIPIDPAGRAAGTVVELMVKPQDTTHPDRSG